MTPAEPAEPGAPPGNRERRVAPPLGVKQDNTHNCNSNSPFADRRKFLIWACMCGFVGPERVVERILAEIADEESAP